MTTRSSNYLEGIATFRLDSYRLYLPPPKGDLTLGGIRTILTRGVDLGVTGCRWGCTVELGVRPLPVSSRLKHIEVLTRLPLCTTVSEKNYEKRLGLR